MENWKAINEELYESSAIGDIFYNEGLVKRIYPEDKEWKTDESSLVEIYEYVRDHFEWNNRYAYTVIDLDQRNYGKKVLVIMQISTLPLANF